MTELQAGSFAVLGAAGKTGRAVVRALRRRGAFVRAVVRRPVDPGDAAVGGADEVAVADLSDPAAVSAALQAAGGAYLMAPNLFADEPGAMRAALQACDEHGVPRVVYHSVMHPYAPAMPHHVDKAEVEAVLHAGDLDWTVLQPASYFENALGVWDRITDDGVWPVPYSPHAPFTSVALDDVAAAAARVLTEAGHTHATYELTGPQTLTTAEMAAQAAEELGHPVQARQVDVPPGAPPRLRAMFDYYSRSGFRGSPRQLAALLGRAPTSWREWCAARTPPTA